MIDSLAGLSPRVRGNQNTVSLFDELHRSIPACAGEPLKKNGTPARNAVYPRVCGGTAIARGHPATRQGLSPRVRGNRPRERRPQPWPRSIPACAGEPYNPRLANVELRVYPRVCGGTLPLSLSPMIGRGLSPRVRGNQLLVYPVQPDTRSIPACAGEPQHFDARRIMQGVYPRVCGGTHRPTLGPGSQRWSIPACAGEPSAVDSSLSTPGVYPRVCGGTPVNTGKRGAGQGLSPRVRGNPPRIPGVHQGGGSIPACAGEPTMKTPCVSTNTVYPRVCGGTYANPYIWFWSVGLSPRVRGNLRCVAAPNVISGSIPACAGEPDYGAYVPLEDEVYPRVCGGT